MIPRIAFSAVVCFLSLLPPFVLALADEPPVGSEAFQASIDHPLGWRGDATGRFPGAMPPTTWSRRIADSAITDAAYSASKPADSAARGSATPLELGIVKDWLVLGPFPSDDPAKDIDKPFVEGEGE